MTAMTTLEMPLKPRRIRPAAVAVAALAVVLASYGAAAYRATPPPTANTGTLAGDGARDDVAIDPPGAPLLAAGSIEQIDHSIGLFTGNIARETRDYLSATDLGMLYEARARLTGDIADYGRAQQALQQALAIEPHEMSARVTHARVLASLHDFTGALAETQAIVKDDATQLAAVATAGDAELELGDVAAAAASYEALAKAAPGAAVDARMSRLAFIQGHAADAWQLASRAYDEASRDGSTGPARSWYAYVLGTLAITAGQPGQALDWFNRAVADWPGSFLAHAGVGRAQAALGRTDAAIAGYEAAIAIAPQPDAVAALGDVYALRGDTALASQQYATVEAIAHLAALNEQVFNRQLVLFSVNHDRDLAQALVLAQQELTVRKDAYGYDAVAWALLANGRATDADTAIRQAMAFGTADPLLQYHAGLIARALGDVGRARTLLTAALAAPGAIDPLATSRAQATLATLATLATVR
jgi:tetratricopeptide (TPR) repeat protein